MTSTLNETPKANRIHIGIFGRRNAGKSSLINALTGQDLAIVNPLAGTTTDPVSKAMELLPLGPVVLIDTPGIDDEGELGRLRVLKAYQVLNKTDIALLVVDAVSGLAAEDVRLWQQIRAKRLPALLLFNKCDLATPEALAALAAEAEKLQAPAYPVSAKAGTAIHQLKEAIAALHPVEEERQLVGDLIAPEQVVVLVTPIDSAAPKGRLILPQQQVLRDVLDHQAIALVVQANKLAAALQGLTAPPALVVTDSQAFAQVAAVVPPSVPLTSFSILFARYKGGLRDAVAGVRMLDRLQDGDKVLIAEGCTHHRQCEDIGTVKLPRWIRAYSKAQPAFSWTSGTEFPLDLSPYKLIIHCGACMLNEKEAAYRYRCAADQGVAMCNYGIAIAYMHGILQRSVAPLPGIGQLLQEEGR